MNSFGCRVLADSAGTPILCEEIAFEDLQSFLYYDFFRESKRIAFRTNAKTVANIFFYAAGNITITAIVRSRTNRIRPAAPSVRDAAMRTSAKTIPYGKSTTARIRRIMRGTWKRKWRLRSSSSGRDMMWSWESKRAMGGGVWDISWKNQKMDVYFMS